MEVHHAGISGSSNSFISKINPTVSTVSILPAARNISHSFLGYQSFKLGSASEEIEFAFIFCTGYLRSDMEKWKLQNRATLAIYKARKTI